MNNLKCFMLEYKYFCYFSLPLLDSFQLQASGDLATPLSYTPTLQFLLIPFSLFLVKN